MRQIAKAGMAAVAMVLLCADIAAADCTSRVGQRAVLASDGLNPDVFVWDTRARLLNYLGGGDKTTKSVMDHTLLVAAGTVADVLSCHTRDTHNAYDPDANDVLAVRIRSGEYRSRVGWIAAGDAHVERKPAAR